MNRTFLLFRRPRVAVLFFLGAALAAPGLWWFARPAYVVVLTPEGFEPREIDIRGGERVRFETTRGKPFWPASDLHPSHGIYEEFDATGPIARDASWTFRFTKAGDWGFHDHLAPHFRGVIRVRSVSSESAALAERCRSGEERGQLRCWEEEIVKRAEAGGLSAAFGLFSELYDTDPLFRRYCHDYVHALGAFAYERFAAGEDPDVTAETRYCAFGFYHGFMELLVAESGNVSLAREFCLRVRERLADSAPGVFKPCFHGVGHGWAAVHENEDVTGKTEFDWIDPALALCEKVTQVPEELLLCRTGVFDSLAVDYYNESYGFSMNMDDPLRVCHAEEAPLKRPCYMEMTTAVVWLADYDLARGLEIVRTHTEPEYLELSIRKVAENSVRFFRNRTDHAPAIAVCRALPEDLRIPCLTGVAEGYVQFGPPGSEYTDGIAFCADEALAPDEKEPCYVSVLAYARQIYSFATFEAVCGEVEPPYGNLCSKIQ